MASGGTGTTTHLAGELLKMMAGIDMMHVPYRGTGPAITDLLGGQVQVMFGSAPSSVQYIRNGQLRALAVTSRQAAGDAAGHPDGRRDDPGLRGVAVVRDRRAEGDAGADRRGAQQGDQRVARRPEDEGEAASTSAAPMLPGSAAEFAQLIVDETEKWSKVVKFAKVKPN